VKKKKTLKIFSRILKKNPTVPGGRLLVGLLSTGAFGLQFSRLVAVLSVLLNFLLFVDKTVSSDSMVYVCVVCVCDFSSKNK